MDCPNLQKQKKTCLENTAITAHQLNTKKFPTQHRCFKNRPYFHKQEKLIQEITISKCLSKLSLYSVLQQQPRPRKPSQQQDRTNSVKITCIMLILSDKIHFLELYKNLKDPILPSKKCIDTICNKIKLQNNFVNTWFALNCLIRPLFRRPSFHMTCKSPIHKVSRSQ